MIFASLCSGIEAASLAWKPLGWRCAFVAEVEPFCCALLKHYYPETPNYGDILKANEWPLQPIDVLVGGTPCQSFSVAGLRKGLADPRGNLALAFLGVVERYRPKWVVWENVPGVHSSWSDAENRAPSEESARLLRADGLDPGDFIEVDQSNDFDCFLAGLEQLGYGIATRILDAQYSGLAQRRERVFVVGHIGGAWQRAAAVLFDAPRLRWNPPPSRETKQRVAPTVEGRAGRSGCNNFATSGGLAEVAGTIRERKGGGCSTELDGHGAYVPEVSRSVRAQSQSSHREDSESFVPVVRCAIRSGSDSPAAHGKVNGTDRETLIAHTLRAEGHDASEDGTGRGVPLVAMAQNAHGGSGRMDGEPETFIPVAFTCKDNGRDASADVSPTLRSMNHSDSHANGGGQMAVNLGMAVRRLTPRECERLFGFPDDYSLIPYRGKPACDGPRYRALGNSFPVPVISWIGRRIQQVKAL